jgi:shikimate 5-dehydrogenase
LTTADTQLILSVSNRPGNFGRRLYGELFRHLDIDALYLPRRLGSPGEFDTLFDLFLETEVIKGMSVSMPFKQRALVRALAAEFPCSSEVAINTMVRDGDRRSAHLTDADIYKRFFATYAQDARRVLVYGSGAMAALAGVAATEHGLVTESIDRNSTPQDVAAMMGAAGDRAQPASTLLVNATPLPRRELPIPYLAFLAFLDLPVILDDTRDFEGLNGFEATIIQFSRQASLYTSTQLDEAFVADLVRIVFQD